VCPSCGGSPPFATQFTQPLNATLGLSGKLTPMRLLDHSQPAFAVVEGKALEYALVKHELDGLEWLRDQLQAREDELAHLDYTVGRMQLGMHSR
jgi:hypothetical protein